MTDPRKLGLSLLLAAGAGLLAPTTAGARDLVVATTASPRALDPMQANTTPATRIISNILETLVEYDYESRMIEPLLATSWEMIDDRTVEFTLRDGVKCHNGEDFTAEDVVISLGPQRYLGDGAPGWTTAREYFLIESVEAVDRLRVRIRNTEPDPLVLRRFSSWMSQMVCGDAYLAAASWEDWGRNVVGTGAFRLVSLDSETVRIEANPDYWGEPSPVAAVTYTVVPEVASRIAGLITGEYDFITDFTPDQFETIEASGSAYVVDGATGNIRWIVYDHRHPVLADPRMRVALSWAIDRDLIVETLFRGQVVVPNSFQSEMFGDMFIADHQPIGYDPDKARALIAEAGYNGEEIAYRYRQDFYPGEVQTAQILQAMWRDVGLNVVLELKETSAEIQQPGLGIYNLSQVIYWNDPIGGLWRHLQPGGFIPNRENWSSEEFFALGPDLFSNDLATRRAAFAAMLQIVDYGGTPGTFLHELPGFWGVSNSIEWKPPLEDVFMDFRAGAISFRD